MRILHIIQRYWPAVGGAETYFGEISARFAAEGHEVTVAATDALDLDYFWDRGRRHSSQRLDQHAGVRILRFPARQLPLGAVAYAGVRRLLWLLSKTRVAPVAALHRLARVTPWSPDLWQWLATTEEQFDLVAGTVICLESVMEAGLRFAQRRAIPFVAYPLTHLGAGSQPADDALSSFYTMRHQVDLVRSSTATVCMTPTEAAFYAAHGAPAASLLVAGPGVTPTEVLGGDGARFRLRHGISGPLVVSLASMAYDKGTMQLVEAVQRLRQGGQTVDLVLAGAITQPFRAYLAGLSLADQARLHVLGPVDDAEKRDLLAAADVFAMPSRTDSFGIVYLEAWLYRKPVIGARTWGVMDVIEDGRDGLLVPFGDAAGLAAALSELLSDPARRDQMGAYGEEKVYRMHTWGVKYPLIRNLYQQLVAHRRG